MLEVFLVYECDGYKNGKLLAGFTNRADADKLKEKCGGYASIEELKTTVYRTWKEFETYSPMAMREKALAKLTAEERKLLNL